jgi:AbrB family looped-hinge helix DNA binding protein
MPVSTLTSKGQITLPQAVRSELGIETGDKVDFVRVEDGFKLVVLRKDVRCLKGRFAERVNKPVTIEQMNQAIAQGAARRARRRR